MTTATVTENGQILLPSVLLERLGAHAGDKLELRLEEDGSVRICAKTLKSSEVLGMLASRTSVKSTVAEMDEAVAEAFRKEEAVLD